MTKNEAAFREAYAVKLAEAIARRPDDFDYTADPENIAKVVDKMIPDLRAGRAFMSLAVKATCRAVGIPFTIGAIKGFLSDAGDGNGPISECDDCGSLGSQACAPDCTIQRVPFDTED